MKAMILALAALFALTASAASFRPMFRPSYRPSFRPAYRPAPVRPLSFPKAKPAETPLRAVPNASHYEAPSTHSSWLPWFFLASRPHSSPGAIGSGSSIVSTNAPAPSSKAKDNKTNWWALGGFSAVLAAFLGWAFTREDQ